MNYNELTRPSYEINYLPLNAKMQKFNESSYMAIETLNTIINYGIDLSNLNMNDRGKQRETANMIINSVCDYFKTTIYAINRGGRKAEVIKAKQIIIYFLRKYTKFSLNEIAKYFPNNRNIPLDHTTVLHADNKVKDFIIVDKEYRTIVRDIQAMFIYV